MKTEMTEHGAALQTYNQELVKCLEDLKTKRNAVLNILYREEAEQVVLDKNIKALEEKRAVLNQSLNYHKQVIQEYEKAIKDTEAGFKKILESSQALLNLAQHEATKLESSNNPSPTSTNNLPLPYSPSYEPNY